MKNGVGASAVGMLTDYVYTLDVTVNTGASTVTVTVPAAAFNHTSDGATVDSADTFSNTYTVPYVFASDYSGKWDTYASGAVKGTYTIASVEGGKFGIEIDPATTVKASLWWGGLVSKVADQAVADPTVYWGYGINPAGKPSYFRGYVNAPGNGTAPVSDSYLNLNIVLSAGLELLATEPTVDVSLVGPKVGTCTPVLTSPVKLQNLVTVTDTNSYGTMTLHSLPLSGFEVETPCSSLNTRALMLANGINTVRVSVPGKSIQYVTKKATDTSYPNGINIGKIYFN